MCEIYKYGILKSKYAIEIAPARAIFLRISLIIAINSQGLLYLLKNTG